MMASPDLPNAAMTCWITYIRLFTFKVNHTPGMPHPIPDGLSCRPCPPNDSDYSDGNIDVEDGIKLVKALPLAINTIEYEERKVKDGLCVHEALSQANLERVWGEVKALECCWAFPGTLLHDHCWMYAGVGEEKNLEEESDRLNHQHRVYDRDGVGRIIIHHMNRLWNPIPGPG